jgi:hypothetical protein
VPPGDPVSRVSVRRRCVSSGEAPARITSLRSPQCNFSKVEAAATAGRFLLKLGYCDSFFEAAELYWARLSVIDEALADEEWYPWWCHMVLDW